MKISVSTAKAKLAELMRRAEQGDEIILTRHGRDAVKLIPIKAPVDRVRRRALLEEISRSGARKARPGPSAARSQDFLYGHEAYRSDRA